MTLVKTFKSIKSRPNKGLEPKMFSLLWVSTLFTAALLILLLAFNIHLFAFIGLGLLALCVLTSPITIKQEIELKKKKREFYFSEIRRLYQDPWTLAEELEEKTFSAFFKKLKEHPLIEVARWAIPLIGGANLALAIALVIGIAFGIYGYIITEGTMEDATYLYKLIMEHEKGSILLR